MTRILALNDSSPASAPVNRMAEALAGLLSATVDPVRVLEAPPQPLEAGEPEPLFTGRTLVGPVVEVLLEELTAGDIEFAVMGSRSIAAKPEPAGHVTTALLRHSPVPLVIVPADGHDFSSAEPRLLIPLDGDAETDAAVLGFADRLQLVGARLVTLHVFDSLTLPPFVDTTHDVEILAREYAAQHLPRHNGPSFVRVGDASQEVLAVCDEQNADAIIVVWHQNLSTGRAEVVRRLLRESKVPLIMMPMLSDDGAGTSRSPDR